MKLEAKSRLLLIAAALVGIPAVAGIFQAVPAAYYDFLGPKHYYTILPSREIVSPEACETGILINPPTTEVDVYKTSKYGKLQVGDGDKLDFESDKRIIVTAWSSGEVVGYDLPVHDLPVDGRIHHYLLSSERGKKVSVRLKSCELVPDRMQRYRR